MITEKDLQDAIAECQGVRHPSASTCIKLAAFFTIYDHLYPKNLEPPIKSLDAYSYQSKNEEVVSEYGDSEFYKVIAGRDADKMWEIINELMDTLAILNPKLYNSVIEKLRDR